MTDPAGGTTDLVPTDFSRALVEQVADRVLPGVQDELPSADAIRRKIGLSVAAIVERCETLVGSVEVKDASQLKSMIGAAHQLVELATGYSVLEFASELPDDPREMSAMLESFRRQAREARASQT